MPVILTVPLFSQNRLFFDESCPLESLFLGILVGQGQLKNGQLKPYSLSPIWREQWQGVPASEKKEGHFYRWRVGLLDDTLTDSVIQGLNTRSTFQLTGADLKIGQVEVQRLRWDQLVEETMRRVKATPNASCYLNLEFITPVILHRHELPFPLPDPVVVFHHYLLAWDTFAPRELWININTLDAIETHMALIDHRLETRQVNSDNKHIKTGFLGQLTYRMMTWEKLGIKFLARLVILARFSEFCGTGEFTEAGLGQTRFSSYKGKREH